MAFDFSRKHKKGCEHDITVSYMILCLKKKSIVYLGEVEKRLQKFGMEKLTIIYVVRNTEGPYSEHYENLTEQLKHNNYKFVYMALNDFMQIPMNYTNFKDCLVIINCIPLGEIIAGHRIMGNNLVRPNTNASPHLALKLTIYAFALFGEYYGIKDNIEFNNINKELTLVRLDFNNKAIVDTCGQNKKILNYEQYGIPRPCLNKKVGNSTKLSGNKKKPGS